MQQVTKLGSTVIIRKRFIIIKAIPVPARKRMERRIQTVKETTTKILVLF